MDILRVAHRYLDQLVVILGVEMRAVLDIALDSPHGLATPFAEHDRGVKAEAVDDVRGRAGDRLVNRRRPSWIRDRNWGCTGKKEDRRRPDGLRRSGYSLERS